MTSAARQAANRRNAQRSTGLRTVAGKAQASRNALRHGLAAPPGPELEPAIASLARTIAGAGASDPECLQVAEMIAEAEFDLRRIRWVRLQVVEDILAHPADLLGPVFKRIPRSLVEAIKREDRDPATARAIYDFRRRLRLPDDRDGVLVLALTRLAAQLGRLDRYERRARSRRNAAIRTLDALTHTKSGGR